MLYSLRLIYSASVVQTAITAHYLPVDYVGQQLYQAAVSVDLRVRRATELPNMADAGEPSLLVDAPVLSWAVRGDEVR